MQTIGEAGAIEIFFDFASPYAYFMLPRLEELAGTHGRPLIRRPIMVWALLKAHGLPAPMEHAVRRDYMLADMARSARFHRMPYRQPEVMAVSTHNAARAWYGLERDDAAAARRFGEAVFRARFAEGRDIGEAGSVAAIGREAGVDAAAAMADQTARAALVETNREAVARGAWGSPFVFVDGQSFFGADRLPQIAWYLSGEIDEITETAG